jgi:H+-transporting ATPase
VEFVAFLSIGFFWLHDILLSLIGMTFLVFANDFVSMTLASDNAKSTGSPNKWNLKNIFLASVVPALFYVLEDIIIVLIGIHWFHLQWPELTSLVMLSFIINSQFRVLIVRERKHFWSSLPGKGLLISCSSAIVGIVLISLFGILVPSLNLYVVLSVIGISALFTFGIDFPKYYLFKKFEL